MSTKVGVIIGSTRKPRVCPQIAKFVIETIKSGSLFSANSLELVLIDLADWNLPFFDESNVPSQIMDYKKYDHEHTRRWSQEIQKYHSFIFVVPQYNWGYPAVLKNAIDYLYHEWEGKPAMIVTYGGHGGIKCNSQLTEVLQGVRMKPTQKKVLLTFEERTMLLDAVNGRDLGLDGTSKVGAWCNHRLAILEAFEEFHSLLSTAQ
ncbi:LAFE_0G06612g1_1 [Lachancea fermentati]|uniref:LAFE_0G06612g1_1 n=1 Tax=Lachancea fermentati TaxID=4955 RepID=A0A1G4MHM5_LACFM|nr:LAFE_0G06612g1_1 [Lachancea fermentati]